jgi:hypothetical protein
MAREYAELYEHSTRRAERAIMLPRNPARFGAAHGRGRSDTLPGALSEIDHGAGLS